MPTITDAEAIDALRADLEADRRALARWRGSQASPEIKGDPESLANGDKQIAALEASIAKHEAWLRMLGQAPSAPTVSPPPPPAPKTSYTIVGLKWADQKKFEALTKEEFVREAERLGFKAKGQDFSWPIDDLRYGQPTFENLMGPYQAGGWVRYETLGAHQQFTDLPVTISDPIEFIGPQNEDADFDHAPTPEEVFQWHREHHLAKDVERNRERSSGYVPEASVLENREFYRQRNEIERLGKSVRDDFWCDPGGSAKVGCGFRQNEDRGAYDDAMSKLGQLIAPLGAKLRYNPAKRTIGQVTLNKALGAQMLARHGRWVDEMRSAGARILGDELSPVAPPISVPQTEPKMFRLEGPNEVDTFDMSTVDFVKDMAERGYRHAGNLGSAFPEERLRGLPLFFGVDGPTWMDGAPYYHLFDPKSFSKIVADSPEQIRAGDLERLIDETPTKHRMRMVDWLKAERPDLARRVDAIMGQIAAADEMFAAGEEGREPAPEAVRTMMPGPAGFIQKELVGDVQIVRLELDEAGVQALSDAGKTEEVYSPEGIELKWDSTPSYGAISQPMLQWGPAYSALMRIRVGDDFIVSRTAKQIHVNDDYVVVRTNAPERYDAGPNITIGEVESGNVNRPEEVWRLVAVRKDDEEWQKNRNFSGNYGFERLKVLENPTPLDTTTEPSGTVLPFPTKGTEAGGARFTYYIHGPGGMETLRNYSKQDLIDKVQSLGDYKHTGEMRNASVRPELQGQPVFSGLDGPTWGGDGPAYEVNARWAEETKAGLPHGTPLEHISTKEAIERIRAGLKSRSKKLWTVGTQRGSHGYIHIQSPPSRMGPTGMTVEEGTELQQLLGLPTNTINFGAISVPPDPGYYEEYIDRAWGRQPKRRGVFVDHS